MTHTNRRFLSVLMACGWPAVLMMLGCPKPVPPQMADELGDEGPAPIVERTTPAAGARAPVTDCSVIRVSFAFDSAALSAEAQRTLDANAACIERMGYKKVTVEGHCCELGSTEYNLALGQRRADAVRKYLTNLGVDPQVVRSISYGEEHPLVNTKGEVNWSQNRRGELVCDLAEPLADRQTTDE